MRIYVAWPRQRGKRALAKRLKCEDERAEMTVINPPGPDWHDRLFRRLREALERARRDDCTRCRAEGAGFRHWAYPSECERHVDNL